MKHIRSLYRSPLKTVLTLLLLAAAAFLFLYNLSEYSVSDREYREARDKYEGVLTVEAGSVPDNSSIRDYFLLTDETNPGNTHELLYEDYHQQSLGADLMEKLSALPHISRTEKRYLAAGVSSAYIRLDTDQYMYPYYARCVLTATLKYRYYSSTSIPAMLKRWQHAESLEFLTLEDVEVLAGDPAWLKGQELQTVRLEVCKEEYRGKYLEISYPDLIGKRNTMFTVDNNLFLSDLEALQPGRRYVFVLRNNNADQPIAPLQEFEGVYPEGYVHLFEMGDDSLIGWWPYYTDITDLPENWLETEEFADLRELIRVTEDDVHTFDVVYGDDMAALRRAADGRIVCQEGRFITPADAGQEVCVVNADLLETYGLKVGDSITLDLGNYLSEQYAPLGAVAVTRGRQSTEYKTQTFTIIGSWRDLNEGNHVYRDRYWCWSNNAIFVPTAFLPECVNAQGHEFKPGEVSFVVGNAEEIEAFVEDCLPQLEAMGLTYSFSDGGWLQIGEELMQSRSLALVKLLIFSGAALFALILTVWLFIGRKKREYGILRALGMPRGEASNSLFIPFLLLGAIAVILGMVVARIVAVQQLAADHVPARLSLFLLGAVGFLVLLAVMAFVGILLIRRKSILALIQGKQK
ncbi:MAG: ABC transporter permease [Oscillospiraceae bacterium]|nr:ABC transporter permease [Oscillospiraceae bacterium]